MSGVLVRPFRREDLEASFDLWLGAWSTVLPPAEVETLLPGWRRHFLEDLLPGSIVIAAEAPDRLAGFAVYDPRRAWLDQLIVDRDRHRSGIGRALMEAVGRIAEGGEIRFRVMKANAGALAFYDRIGGRREGETRSPTTGWPSWRYAWQPAARGSVTDSSGRIV